MIHKLFRRSTYTISVSNPYGPDTRVSVLIAYSQILPINAYAEVSSEAIGPKIGHSIIIYPDFVYASSEGSALHILMECTKNFILGLFIDVVNNSIQDFHAYVTNEVNPFWVKIISAVICRMSLSFLYREMESIFWDLTGTTQNPVLPYGISKKDCPVSS